MPLTRTIPKEMLPLGRKPVISHILDESQNAGICCAVLVVSPEKLSITSFLDGSDGISVRAVLQNEQLGLGHAVLQAESVVDNKPFAIALGDSTIHSPESFQPFSRLLAHFIQTDADGIILVQRTPLNEAGRYGIVKPQKGISEPFEIVDLIEKPSFEQLQSQLTTDGQYAYAIAGRYAFKPVIFEYLRKVKPGAGNELQLTDAIRDMLYDGHKIWCTPLRSNELRRDIGTFKSYFEAFCAVALEDPECGDYIRESINLSGHQSKD